MMKSSFSRHIRSMTFLIIGVVLGVAISQSITIITYWGELSCADMPLIGGTGNLKLYANTEKEFALFMRYCPIVFAAPTETNHSQEIIFSVPLRDIDGFSAFSISYDDETKKILQQTFCCPTSDNDMPRFIYRDDDGDGLFDVLYYRDETGVQKEYHFKKQEDGIQFYQKKKESKDSSNSSCPEPLNSDSNSAV